MRRKWRGLVVVVLAISLALSPVPKTPGTIRLPHLDLSTPLRFVGSGLEAIPTLAVDLWHGVTGLFGSPGESRASAATDPSPDPSGTPSPVPSDSPSPSPSDSPSAAPSPTESPSSSPSPSGSPSSSPSAGPSPSPSSPP